MCSTCFWSVRGCFLMCGCSHVCVCGVWGVCTCLFGLTLALGFAQCNAVFVLVIPTKRKTQIKVLLLFCLIFIYRCIYNLFYSLSQF